MRLKNVIHASTYIRGYPMLTLYIADAERDAGMKNLSRKEALEILNGMKVKIKIPKAAVMQNKRNAALDMAIEALKYSEIPNSSTDCISRQAAIETISRMMPKSYTLDGSHPADEEIFMAQEIYADCIKAIEKLPSVQPERIWHSCKTPPKHHKDVLVRGTEAIGNVTTYKVMQWDVDAWRPTDYAPSIIWEEWSEI